MGRKSIRIGESIVSQSDKTVSGSFVELKGERYYRIERVDGLRPFLMSLVSASDHWMFISSNGALTAGRKDADSALFPYCTDDKIHDSADVTGSKTILLIEGDDSVFLWEPFSRCHEGLYQIDRNLYKELSGTRIRFEEVNYDLGLTFWYEWGCSDSYGFVKKAGLKSERKDAAHVRVLDGIQNVLPYGVDRRLQNERSTLVDAYKKGELQIETGLGLFSLSSMIVDRPEPAEALKATTVFTRGLTPSGYLISSRQIQSFRKGLELETEEDVRAERGAYFVQAELKLSPHSERTWLIIAEVNQGPERVADLASDLLKGRITPNGVEEDVIRSTNRLRSIAAGSDALQATNNPLSDARHFSNVLFNVMRGGVIERGYELARDDFSEFVQGHNRLVFDRHADALSGLPPFVILSDLRNWIATKSDPQLTRLSDEYLPLSFSRRHGDPSRPWNAFSIKTRKANGDRNLYFEGNWRDIFQNWEALAISFPEFVPNMIAKFVNASTVDGYNPYRITRDGIDWETVDPKDPWSHIGYWGDHQIIYLLKLLELSSARYPGDLQHLLNERRFAYADVPYRIAAYTETLQDPHHTIFYDIDRETEIQHRVSEKGADGKLVTDAEGQVVLVGFGEKLLVPTLAKLSNFIPGAGIWMNTQRPEWNDANNALVGFGVSVVTLCYLRRFLTFARGLFEGAATDIEVSEEIATFFFALAESLKQFEPLLAAEISDMDRRKIQDALGGAGSAYRTALYECGFSGRKRAIGKQDLDSFFACALSWVDHTIRSNRRDDGLFHAYNLIEINGSERISIKRLYEMLEGQVAVLSSGLVGIEESIGILTALRGSSLFREDQHSYLLYPDRQLARFIEKNMMKPDRVRHLSLVERLEEDGDKRLLIKDSKGEYHFNGAFRNGNDVEKALQKIRKSGYEEEVERDRDSILSLFEEVFDHRSFTGRSGTFFGYEGLGCIYWHMVSKLLLTTGEVFHRAFLDGADPAKLRELAGHYYDIRQGLGQNKSPAEYGAFPMDPYSHTPGNRGARQPGMTGQVKEDILARWHELGVSIRDGCMHFEPALLKEGEFVLSGNTSFAYVDLEGTERSLDLESDTLAFTYCQVPIVYHRSRENRIQLSLKEGLQELDGLVLDETISKELFSRSGRLQRVDVFLSPGL